MVDNVDSDTGELPGITRTNEEKTVDAVFNSMEDANLVPATGAGITIDLNVTGTNKAYRKLLTVENYGGRVRVRLSGSSARGVTLSKNEYWEREVGPGITFEVVEANGANEIKIYVAEFS